MMRVAAVGMGCVLAFALAEILLRVMELAPSQAVGSVDEVDFSLYPGLLTPGQELVDRQKPALPYQVRINSLGYRGADFPAVKRPGEFRVLAVGDSFSYGSFVDDAEALPARLAAGLSARCGNATVINAGIGGTTLITQAAMVQRALALEPDVVLLTFSENDINDLATPLWHSLAENRARKSRFPLRYLYPILRHTAVWNFALEVRATLAAKTRGQELARIPETAQGAASPGAGVRKRSDRQRELRDEYTRRLSELRNLLTSKRVPLLFALYPSHHAVDDPKAREQMHWVERMGRSLSIDTVSLLDALEASGKRTDALYLLPEDGHPSALGYELSARELLRRFDWAAYSGGACAR